VAEKECKKLTDNSKPPTSHEDEIHYSLLKPGVSKPSFETVFPGQVETSCSEQPGAAWKMSLDRIPEQEFLGKSSVSQISKILPRLSESLRSNYKDICMKLQEAEQPLLAEAPFAESERALF
jgi:hypothetical protein